MGRKKSDSGRRRAVRATVQRLESLERAGVTHLGKPARTSAEGEPEARTDDRAAALAEVQREVAACARCKELARTRTQTVFGVGSPHARLVFVGEAPGADEDRQGEPFVGAAGQLLTRIIEACTLRREDVYIGNILRCRPPDNRNPLPAEAANCREYLDRTLAIIRPEFICCLGTVAAQNLLGTTESIGQLRGRMHDYEGIRVVCTYHPAYLLRTPSAKRKVWEDMQMLMAEMGIELPQK
ncbi:MAG TPA: uracil-DNA glycosylase [Thermoguttaceae bacterium]|nr:uracil-DNA glycosylase [Thermoguttaceae bacterium]